MGKFVSDLLDFIEFVSPSPVTIEPSQDAIEPTAALGEETIVTSQQASDQSEVADRDATNENQQGSCPIRRRRVLRLSGYSTSEEGLNDQEITILATLSELFDPVAVREALRNHPYIRNPNALAEIMTNEFT